MKAKLIALALICTSAVSVFAGCSNSNYVSTPKTTDRTDIAFVASYDKDSKEINTTLTNNTGDEIILFQDVHNLYKKVEDDKWEIVKFDNLFTAAANYVFAEENLKSTEVNFPAYNTAGENINLTEEKEKGGLDAGEYKITMLLKVYPDSEASTIPHGENETISVDNPDGKYLNSAKATHEEITVGTDFTVE